MSSDRCADLEMQANKSDQVATSVAALEFLIDFELLFCLRVARSRSEYK